MWTRAEMKHRAKNTVRNYFWPALAVSMLNSLFNSNGGSSSGGAQVGANVSEELDLELESIINAIVEESEYLKEVHHWGDIYRYIHELEENNAG